MYMYIIEGRNTLINVGKGSTGIKLVMLTVREKHTAHSNQSFFHLMKVCVSKCCYCKLRRQRVEVFCSVFSNHDLPPQAPDNLQACENSLNSFKFIHETNINVILHPVLLISSHHSRFNWIVSFLPHCWAFFLRSIVMNRNIQ